MVKAKKELVGKVKVKKEPEVKALHGFARSAKEHYVFQVAFINSVAPQPWDPCFGGLGTGIVGVCPAGTWTKPTKPTKPGWMSRPQSSTSQNLDTSQAPVVDADLDVVGGEVPAEDADAAVDEDDGNSADVLSFPLETTIIIFVNAPAHGLGSRSGRVLGGYSETINTALRTFQWSGQRCDKKAVKVKAIMAHRARGGRVVVAVRPFDDRTFRLLGEVSLIDGFHEHCCLVDHGDDVIQERGTHTFHKAITVQCLNLGLRSGIGLFPTKYLPTRIGLHRLCNGCCYEPAKITFHFDELSEKGITAFQLQATPGVKRERVKKEVKEEEDAGSPVVLTKRLKGKQTIIKSEFGSVKTELDENGELVQPVDTPLVEPDDPPLETPPKQAAFQSPALFHIKIKREMLEELDACQFEKIAPAADAPPELDDCQFETAAPTVDAPPVKEVSASPSVMQMLMSAAAPPVMEPSIPAVAEESIPPA